MNKTKIEQPQSVSGAFDELLNKMYISNVQNRLRQLNEPTENDCKRWVWELIQNAKDSISQDDNRNSVDLRMVVRDKDVKFSHNGSPFTAKAQLGLLYKYSEGKVNNSESTGRFGTGFLTTHTLSKIVSIEGNVLTDNISNPLCGFSATMYRDGLDEPELLAGVQKMKDSMVYTEELNEWTTYTYHLRTPQNENALRLGLENFISNISQTMLFCKELKSVELDNNGVVTKIKRLESKLIDDELFLSIFEIESESQYTRSFVHKSIKRTSDDLSKRFKIEREIRLTAAIEVDNKTIVENQESPSHFCVLPLVGSENHIMPIYLNSPDFEPDSERESLILIGEDILADKNVISDGGINRLILKESIPLYECLVKYLSSNNYKNLFQLAKGLKRLPRVDKNFNKEWFENEITNPFREVLEKYDIVETEIGNQKLFLENKEPNIIIPKDSNHEKQSKIYSLCSDIFVNRLPNENIAKEWAEYAWKNCGLYELDDLCKYISEKNNVSNLGIESNHFDWLNNFLSFIKETDESLFKEYALIPNKNGDFVSLQNEHFAEGIGLTDYMLLVLKDLGEDLSSILLHENITSITLPIKIDAKIIADKIFDKTNSIIKDDKLSIKEVVIALLPILNTVPSDELVYSLEFIHKQKQTNSFAATLFDDVEIEINKNNDIPEKAWEILHKWIIDKLMQLVSSMGNIESLPNSIENKVVWINSFIAFVSKEIKEGKLDEHSIIPNQKDTFCFRKDLFKDVEIPEELKSEKAEIFGIKLRDVLLHKEINSANITSEKNINSVIELINNIFKLNQIEEGFNKLEFAIFLTHFLPKETSPLLFNSQKILLNIVQKYYYEKCNTYSQSVIACDIEDFWSKANNEITKSLQNHIAEYSNLENLKVYLSISGKTFDKGDTIIFLNNLYDYLKSSNKSISGKIIPNQNGNFCSLEDEFYKDDNIPDELKQILYLVNPLDDFKTILAEKSLSIQPAHSKKLEDIAKVIDDSIKETYSDPKNWDNEKFKSAVQLLMINWFPNRNQKESKDYFQYTFGRKETIEMNVLWSLEERQRMQKAKSIAPELLDKFIESSGDIDNLNKEKQALEAQIIELKSQIENPNLNVNIDEIAKEFPNLTADRIRELLEIEEILKDKNISSQSELKASSFGLYPLGSEDDIAISPTLTDNSSEKSRISVSDDAKEIIFQTLTEKGFNVSESIKINYTIVDGIFNPNGNPIKIVVKSAKAGKIYFNPNEWLTLTEPDTQLFVVTRGNIVRNITLSDIESLNDTFHMRLNTESFAMTNLKVFAKFFQYLPYTHFIFESPDSTTDYLQQFGLSERNPSSSELSADDKNLLL